MDSNQLKVSMPEKNGEQRSMRLETKGNADLVGPLELLKLTLIDGQSKETIKSYLPNIWSTVTQATSDVTVVTYLWHGTSFKQMD